MKVFQFFVFKGHRLELLLLLWEKMQGNFTSVHRGSPHWLGYIYKVQQASIQIKNIRIQLGAFDLSIAPVSPANS